MRTRQLTEEDIADDAGEVDCAAFCAAAANDEVWEAEPNT